jgi:OOP family OmpA-OmpF porin
MYLAPFGSFLQPGGDSAGHGGWGTGLGVGKVLNQHFNVELRGFWQNFDNDLSCCGGAETDLVGATADLQYYFLRDTFSPYAVVSAGGMTTDIKGPSLSVSQESFVFEAGIGSTYSLYKQLLLRGDVRYRLNTLPDSLGQDGVLNDAVVNLGFVVPFGI